MAVLYQLSYVGLTDQCYRRRTGGGPEEEAGSVPRG